MQIPEWYTGSDDSGRVAAGIERAIERMDERTADHSDIADLEKLLADEEEINWRNFLHGLVRLVFNAIGQRDLPVVRDIVLFMAAAVVVVNFVVDMAYAALDPRIRLQ